MAQYVCKTRERVVCIRAFSLGPARTFKWRIVWLQDSYRFSFFTHDTLPVPVRHSSVITAVWKIDSRVIIWSAKHSHIVLHNPSSDRHIFLALDEWFFKSLSHSFSTSLAFVLPLPFFLRLRPARTLGSSSRTTSRWRTARTTTAATPSMITITSNRRRELRPLIGNIQCEIE